MSSKSFASRRGALCVAAACVLLSACESSDVATIQGATRDQLGAIRVSDVAVTLAIPKPNPVLEATLRDQLVKTTPACARGTVDHRLEVTVTQFADQNVAQAVLVGDSIELAGKVQLIDAASGSVAGEYYVETSFFWGGLIGAAMMSNAERKLSEDFAEKVCSDVFGVEAKKKG